MKLFFKNILSQVRIFELVLLGKKYIREGKCLACGSCCRDIIIKNGSKIIDTPEYFEELKKKFPSYRNFKITGIDNDVLLFQCLLLDTNTGKCTDYNKRPPVCRNYPNEVIFKLGGSLSDNCGYSFRPIKSFEDVLAKEIKKYEHC